ncbi:PadR-like family transcriptional regulator [Fictibacillus macauensis ZFHKF-1]|uniref:PadR-like family transcriptional regulator n=1 Tax=Fictibacillus macauensis ZFHKF-1 TaxID=1196324 RepID=I8AMQ0_9BACL|nr:PadR family transcriptional regulator [Fictibacillus macauensis]EIT87287.1 PadR-like family transcriptional regulator [Fictibacillus macauensis ZFHKF-1]
MALRYALLGLLTKGEATGYELNQRFKETMIHFWKAHHTQIYRELGKMEQEQLVSSHVIHQVEYPDKKLYKLEKQGQHLLLQWMMNMNVAQPTLKDDLLLKASLFHLIPKDVALSYLQKAKEQHLFGVGLMNEWRTTHFPGNEFSSADLGEYLTSEFGRRYMQHWIDWCDWAMAIIESEKNKESIERKQE